MSQRGRAPEQIFALVADAAKHSEIDGRIWRYELEPVDGGTLVKETWDVSQDKQKFFLKRSRMAPAAKNGMRKTLERIADTVEG